MRGLNLPLAATLMLLLWAVWEASFVDPEKVFGAKFNPVSDPAVVEKSFAPIVGVLESDRTESALLALSRRAEKGPYSGYAYFLLGTRAFGEEAWGATVDNYAKAVEADRTVTDRDGAFTSGAVMLTHLEEISAGPWADKSPAERAKLSYLTRKLSGGCD